MKKYLFISVILLSSILVRAQSNYYTLIQVGANVGLANKGYKGTFSGYSAHFIFGKNFNDKAYLGLGIGNESLMGNYETINSNHTNVGMRIKYDRQVFPIFVDGRLLFVEWGMSSKVGVLANAGYAPSIAANYDKGFLCKGGIFYLKENPRKIDWTVSATYGYHQLSGNIIDVHKKFHNQQLNLPVGIFL